MAKVIGWILGVLAIASVGMHFDNGEVLAGIICFFAIGFAMPPILNKTNASNKRTAEAKGKAYSELPQKSANVLSVVILIVAAFIGSGSDPKPEDMTAEELSAACEDKIMAYVMAQKLVKQNLKSPSTAEFPSYNSSGVTITYAGECVHKVSAFVDSQNAFGATVRTPFNVELKNNIVDETWNFIGINM
tara:strand:- start:4876 stop:5442 length:567 start_codon:yes stop_codon:yes gene_type:complete